MTALADAAEQIKAVKLCRKCGEVKPVEEFHRRSAVKSGRCAHCKTCKTKESRVWYEKNWEKVREKGRRWYQENRERGNATAARWRKANPEKRRVIDRRCNVRRKYGLTLEEYEEILSHGCTICGEDGSKRKLHLDHDHSNGKVRAALCVDCNQGLGRFKDDPEYLSKAILYLEEHSQ